MFTTTHKHWYHCYIYVSSQFSTDPFLRVQAIKQSNHIVKFAIMNGAALAKFTLKIVGKQETDKFRAGRFPIIVRFYKLILRPLQIFSYWPAWRCWKNCLSGSDTGTFISRRIHHLSFEDQRKSSVGKDMVYFVSWVSLHSKWQENECYVSSSNVDWGWWRSR